MGANSRPVDLAPTLSSQSVLFNSPETFLRQIHQKNHQNLRNSSRKTSLLDPRTPYATNNNELVQVSDRRHAFTPSAM